MTLAALARLKGRDPREIARKTGIQYGEEAEAFHITTMGTDATISYLDYRFVPELPGWHRLVILHYLDLADGSLLTGKDIPFDQMKSDMAGGSFREETGIFPGWHMHKALWLSVAPDGTVDDEKVKFLMDMSYELTKK